jgi:hypothetical protein
MQDTHGVFTAAGTGTVAQWELIRPGLRGGVAVGVRGNGTRPTRQGKVAWTGLTVLTRRWLGIEKLGRW